jgi:hypothetical protein
VTVGPDAGFTFVDLFSAFNDDKNADEALGLAVVSNNNANLFASIRVDAPTGLLDLQFAPGVSGTATLIVRATDTAGASTDASFDVTVLPATPAPQPPPEAPPAGQEPTPSVLTGTGTIVGRLVQKLVVNGKRRKAPAAGVEVFLDANDNGTRDVNEPAATTAADGSYAFTTLAAGKYHVRVSSPGWQVAGRGRGKARPVRVRPRQRKAARARPITLESMGAV